MNTTSARTCSIPECHREYYAKGFCEAHYNRARLGMDVAAPMRSFSRDPEVSRQRILENNRRSRMEFKHSKPDSLCVRGRCKKTRDKGRQCFDCWITAKWRGMRQRVTDTKGKNPTYRGLPLTFTAKELVEWARRNPPPPEMEQPSIDKIIDANGYTLDNIRWLPMRVNIRQDQKDTPDGYWICTLCKELKPHTFEFFSRHAGRPHGLHTQCRPCYNAHMREYRKNRTLSETI